MNEIAFDEEYDAVAAIEPDQCMTQNSSLPMSTASGYSAAKQRVNWVAASAASTWPNSSFPDGQRVALLPASHSGEGYAGSHLAAELP